MSTRRLLATVAVMAGIAAVLGVLTPEPATMARAVAAAQRTVDTQGPDALISAAGGLLAGGGWAGGGPWLALTAASALPGLAGQVARLTLRAALPAGARHSAAVLLGIGLGLTAPVAASVLPMLAPIASAADSATAGVPDWPGPSSPAAPVPDWPAATPPRPRSRTGPRLRPRPRVTAPAAPSASSSAVTACGTSRPTPCSGSWAGCR